MKRYVIRRLEKRADVMRRYTAVLNGKKEAAHA